MFDDVANDQMIHRRKISHKSSISLKMFEIALEGRKTCVCYVFVYVPIFLLALNIREKIIWEVN